MNRLGGGKLFEKGFKLSRPLAHATGRAEAWHQHSVACNDQAGRQVTEVASQAKRAELDLIKAEQAVYQHDWRTKPGNRHQTNLVPGPFQIIMVCRLRQPLLFYRQSGYRFAAYRTRTACQSTEQNPARRKSAGSAPASWAAG